MMLHIVDGNSVNRTMTQNSVDDDKTTGVYSGDATACR